MPVSLADLIAFLLPSSGSPPHLLLCLHRLLVYQTLFFPIGFYGACTIRKHAKVFWILEQIAKVALLSK